LDTSQYPRYARHDRDPALTYRKRFISGHRSSAHTAAPHQAWAGRFRHSWSGSRLPCEHEKSNFQFVYFASTLPGDDPTGGYIPAEKGVHDHIVI
jgi:hypothetical protein